MRPNCRSRGVATAEAMVSGLAPGRLELTFMVGKSTCGSGDTGRNRKATIPESAIAMVIRDVATGRRIKGAEKFAVIIVESPLFSHHGLSHVALVSLSGLRLFDGSADMHRKTAGQPIKRQINNWC